jgi:hypothetical protein
MKDSLHFILLGVLGFLGIVMMSIGIMSKTGAETSLAAAATKVEGALKSNPPTLGDVKYMQDSQSKFNSDVGGYENAFLNVEGRKLMTFAKTYSTADDFNTGLASQKLASLKQRFARLKTQVAVPAQLATQAKPPQEEDEAESFWNSTTQDMASRSMQPADIEKAQARLKVMEEVCFTCEKLLASNEHKGAPFSFRGFEFGTFNQEVTSEPKDPWLKHEFVFKFDADLSFAEALMDALLNPTDATVGTTDDKREGLPFELASLLGQQYGRPHVASYKVPAAERKEWGIGDTWSEEQDPNPMDDPPNSQSNKRNEVAVGMEKKITHSQPLRFDLRLFALRANPLWKATYKAPENPEGG